MKVTAGTVFLRYCLSKRLKNRKFPNCQSVKYFLYYLLVWGGLLVKAALKKPIFATGFSNLSMV